MYNPGEGDDVERSVQELILTTGINGGLCLRKEPERGIASLGPLAWPSPHSSRPSMIISLGKSII